MAARDPHLIPPTPQGSSPAGPLIEVPVQPPATAAPPVPPARAESALRLTSAGARRLRLQDLARAVGRPRNHVARELASVPDPELGRMLSSPRTLLVEGTTDQAVLQHLLVRAGDTLSLVHPAGSKTRLAVLHHLHLALEIPHHVLFDGDGGPIQGTSTVRHRVLRSRREATRALLASLRAGAPVDDSTGDWGFGGPTVVGAAWSALETDLEDELSRWPSFMAALRASGGSLGAKRPEHLAAAAASAELADLPSSFRRICAAVTALEPDRPPRPRGAEGGGLGA